MPTRVTPTVSAALGRLNHGDAPGWWREPHPVPLMNGLPLPFEGDADGALDIGFIDRTARAFLTLGTQARAAAAPYVLADCHAFLTAIYARGPTDLDMLRLTDPDGVWGYVTPRSVLISEEEGQAFATLLCDCAWEDEYSLQIVYRGGDELFRVSEQDGWATGSGEVTRTDLAATASARAIEVADAIREGERRIEDADHESDVEPGDAAQHRTYRTRFFGDFETEDGALWIGRSYLLIAGYAPLRTVVFAALDDMARADEALCALRAVREAEARALASLIVTAYADHQDAFAPTLNDVYEGWGRLTAQALTIIATQNPVETVLRYGADWDASHDVALHGTNGGDVRAVIVPASR